jgi:hypothetical protein
VCREDAGAGAGDHYPEAAHPALSRS